MVIWWHRDWWQLNPDYETEDPEEEYSIKFIVGMPTDMEGNPMLT
jgi:hypothetical protein